ncbi:MAG: nucleoside deaminase [Arachnia sp.]
MLSNQDMFFLEQAVDLAEEALNAGDEPFGTVLVLDGQWVFRDHNRISGGDSTRHPEFAVARWAAENLTHDQRAQAVTYTSGEHCAMCAAAHGWVGLGRIVYATSTEQLGEWMHEFGVAPGPVARLSINDVVPDLELNGPAPLLSDRVKDLHRRSRT